MRPAARRWIKRLTVLAVALALLVLLGLEAMRFVAARHGVETVPLPEGSEIEARSAEADYADAYRSPLPDPEVSLESLAHRASPARLLVAEAADEVVYEGRAPGLRYLVSLVLDRRGETVYLTLSTAVFYESPLGLAYFTTVKVGHRRLVPYALYRLVEDLPSSP